MALRAVLCALLLIGVVASPASARPRLDHASPAAGSTVHRAPSQIALTFTEVLLQSGSDAVVRKASGAVVSSGKARVVGNKTQLQVPVSSLSPGKYRVEWIATAADRTKNQGSFTFEFGGNEPPRKSHRRGAEAQGSGRSAR
jgi:methionine-rich copper-binding protein CopC